MLTLYMLGGDRDAIGDALAINTAHTPFPITVGDRRLKFADSMNCYFWEEVGRQIHVPPLLDGIPITCVIIQQRMALEGPYTHYTPGHYQVESACAYVEHSLPSGQNPTFSNMQYVTIWANSLELANDLLDMIQSGTIKPVRVKPTRANRGRIRRWLRETFWEFGKYASYLAR